FGQAAARQYESRWFLTAKFFFHLLVDPLGPTRQSGWPDWRPQQERHGEGARPPRGAKSIDLGQGGGNVDDYLIVDVAFFVRRPPAITPDMPPSSCASRMGFFLVSHRHSAPATVIAPAQNAVVQAYLR